MHVDNIASIYIKLGGGDKLPVAEASALLLFASIVRRSLQNVYHACFSQVHVAASLMRENTP